MLRRFIIRLTAMGMLAMISLTATAADPTIDQVYRAAEVGNYQEAQGMMDQVLRDHPNSGKAHFVESQLLAKQGRFSGAKAELTTAETLAPGLPFAQPSAVQELKQHLASSDQNQPIQSQISKSGVVFPWGMLLITIGFITIVFLIIRSISRNNGMPIQNYGGTPGAMQPYGAGGAGPIPTTGGGIGSGILGGLATGAAVGAGVVAGETLMDHFIDGSRSRENLDRPENDSNISPSQYDMGGNDFGMSDSSSWDDSSSNSDGGDWS